MQGVDIRGVRLDAGNVHTNRDIIGIEAVEDCIGLIEARVDWYATKEGANEA